MSEAQRLTRHFQDIDYSAVATVHDHRVEFVVYAIVGRDEADRPLWHRAGSDRQTDPVESIDEAEPYLHGEVKWDGCSNWHFDEQDRVMLHECDRKGLMNIGEVMARCWDMAKELLLNFYE